MSAPKIPPKSTFTPIDSLMPGPWLDAVTWNDQGLVPVIAQEVGSKDILMMAWMNIDSLRDTLKGGKAAYWSRSRKSYWVKGETSGHFQYVKEIFYDCDCDVLLMKVDQLGSACHTMKRSCFYRKIEQ